MILKSKEVSISLCHYYQVKGQERIEIYIYNIKKEHENIRKALVLVTVFSTILTA